MEIYPITETKATPGSIATEVGQGGIHGCGHEEKSSAWRLRIIVYIILCCEVCLTRGCYNQDQGILIDSAGIQIQRAASHIQHALRNMEFNKHAMSISVRFLLVQVLHQ